MPEIDPAESGGRRRYYVMPIRKHVWAIRKRHDVNMSIWRTPNTSCDINIEYFTATRYKSDENALDAAHNRACELNNL